MPTGRTRRFSKPTVCCGKSGTFFRVRGTEWLGMKEEKVSKIIDATMSKEELLEIAVNRALAEIRINWPFHDTAFSGLRQTDDGGLIVTATVTERDY